MNPLNWRREHQLALVLAAIIGLSIGEVVGFAINGHGHQFGVWLEQSFWVGYSTFGGFMWGIFGATVGAAVVYSVHLMRH